jgi:hypothetical protein
MSDWLGVRDGAADHELERALTVLGQHIAYPATPDTASRVRSALEMDPAEHLAPIPGAHRDLPTTFAMPRPSRLAFVAVCLLVAIVASLALFPDIRTAIADRLGLRGVHISWFNEDPPPPPTSVGAALMLGRPATLPEAQAAVDFPILAPTAAGFAEPQEIYVSGAGAHAMVSFVYAATPDLPAASQTGAGALLTQFAGRSERSLIEKGLHGPSASGDPETLLEPVTVRGEPGFWISGAPHAVFFVCSGAGECRQEPYRLAGDVLLWEYEGVTIRLESRLPRDAALAIAESVRPIGESGAGTSAAQSRYIG